MTDIVERLRDAAISLIDGNAEDIGDKVVILDNAAFEIEKLRAELERLRNVARSVPKAECEYCKKWHDPRLACPEYVSLSSAQCGGKS
jgi:hypothetical protein